MLDFLDDFQKKVVYVFGILIVVILSFVTVVVYNNRNILTGENKIKGTNCPDYWNDYSNGDGSKCINTKHLGTCDVEEMNFSLSKWTGDDGNCHKLKWARTCDLTWDGITNNPNIKCGK
jgi:hypothetical protein